MPELPEVETSRRGIRPHIENRRIAAVSVYQPQLRWPVPVATLQSLAGQTLRQIERRGKYLKLYCDSGYILIHLGMSGSLHISDNNTPRRKHDHIDLHLSSGKILRYHDPRRFGCWLFQPTEQGEHKLLQELGPEPDSDAFTGDYLYRLSRNKTRSVKSWLMDHRTVVGVGNIYAAESLFIAGIHPKRRAGNISRARYAQLVDTIKQVMLAAIAQGGTTLRDFTNSEGKPGYFQQTLMVYGREQLPCRHCQTLIKRTVLGQRSTFYCSRCQK